MNVSLVFFVICVWCFCEFWFDELLYEDVDFGEICGYCQVIDVYFVSLVKSYGVLFVIFDEVLVVLFCELVLLILV